MREYIMLTSLDGKRYFDAALKYQYNPSVENKKGLDEISAKITKSLDEAQAKCAKDFILRYGQESFDFVKQLSLGRPHFLVGKNNLLSWDVLDDEENEEYEVVRFYNNTFDYIRKSYSGYGETVIKESDISKNRVLELLKPTTND